MGLRGLSALILLAFGLCTQVLPAAAQSGFNSGCILDHCQDWNDPNAFRPGQLRPAPFPRQGNLPQRGNASTGHFDFYVLALSWSSGFCATSGSGRSSSQCDPGAGLGFVVHGLWPQFEHGFPSDCDPSSRPLSRQALDMTRGLFPDEGLARYEWRKHGTCSGKAPTEYFADVRAAFEQVHIPDDFKRVETDIRQAPADITRAFEAANPRLRPGMMAVGCTRGVLQEVRICISKDLRDFRPCPEVVRDTCRSRDISVPPIL